VERAWFALGIRMKGLYNGYKFLNCSASTMAAGKENCNRATCKQDCKAIQFSSTKATEGKELGKGHASPEAYIARASRFQSPMTRTLTPLGPLLMITRME
jgi:hypothetical protein